MEDDRHDSYDADYGHPRDGGAWMDSPRGAERVFRGGAWNDSAWNVRSTTRYGNVPALRDSELGFRCARSLLGMDWVRISGGSFEMGSESGESDELPVHTASVSSFQVSRTEVTQGQWKALMGAENNPSLHGDCGDGFPVERVNWYEALEFCNRLSVVSGLASCYTLSGCVGEPGGGMECTDATFAGLECSGYRLPTESEWEFAARSRGGDSSYPWGTETPTCDLAVMWDGDPGCGSYSHDSVCSKSPAGDTEQGLCDMAGNVWEWVWDKHGSYPSEAQVDPLGADSGTGRVGRGGDWSATADLLRTTERGWFYENVRQQDLGFRIARTLSH